MLNSPVLPYHSAEVILVTHLKTMLLVKGRPWKALKVQGGPKAWSHTPRTSVGDSGLASGVGEGASRAVCSLGGSKVTEAP